MADHSHIHIGVGLGDVADSTLRVCRQLGVEQVRLPGRLVLTRTLRPLVPPTQLRPHSAPERWDEAALRAMLARVRAAGLEPTGISLEPTAAILLGHPERDADLKVYCDHLSMAGRLGLGVVTYSFTALRASEGYAALEGAGRGGATLRDFDAARLEGLPPRPDVGEHTYDAMWQRLRYFLAVAVPAAERAGVRLALHPNDPPVPVYRGVAQPLATIEDLLRLLNVVDSPANSLFFDTGVTTEMGASAPALIRQVGGRGRIAVVHFRNVRVLTPRLRYVETFHDDGEADLYACMEALHDVGYDGMIDPDHTPYLTDDSSDTRLGWALAIGGMIALRNAAERAG